MTPSSTPATTEHELREVIDGAIRDFLALDGAVYAAIAATPTPTLDRMFSTLTNAADNSKLWFGVAGALAVFGGPAGRRAATSGVFAIGTASFVTNLVLKPAARRPRPDRRQADDPHGRHTHMPSSSSFPSGHSASAFAFATAVARELPGLGGPARAAAAAVAYSRIHTGVHYPLDVVVGSLVGATSGDFTVSVLWALRSHLAGAVAALQALQ